MLAVIAVPDFDPADAAWIATLRALHDPLHGQVAAHVTLRFPHDPPDAAALTAVLAAAAAAVPPFPVTFDRLERLEDPYRPKYRHLVAAFADAAGAARLAALQAMLGEAAASAPHLTLCRFGAAYPAKALLRQINGLAQPLRGLVSAVDVLRIENGRIEMLARHPLVG